MGFVYKLCDGAMMSWHGATQRLCTSIWTFVGSSGTDPNANCIIPDVDVYGFHFINSMPNIELFPLVRKNQHDKFLHKKMMATKSDSCNESNTDDSEDDMTSTSSVEYVDNPQLQNNEIEKTPNPKPKEGVGLRKRIG